MKRVTPSDPSQKGIRTDAAEWEGRAKKLTPSLAAYKAKKRAANRKAKKAAALSKRRNRKK